MNWLWFVLLAVAVILVAGSLSRLKIERDPGREGIQDFENARAYNFVGRLPPFWLARRLLFKELRSMKPAGTILDAGCGPGYLVRDIARYYPESDLIGLDISQDMLRMAPPKVAGNDHNQPQFITGDVHCLPLKDSSVDFVVSTLSMHHWRDPGKALSEFYRVLKPGGGLLIMDPRRDGPLIFFAALWLSQVLGPPPIQKANGAVGSIWASYTPGEVGAWLAESPFQGCSVNGRFGWFFASGRKKPLSPPAVL